MEDVMHFLPNAFDSGLYVLLNQEYYGLWDNYYFTQLKISLINNFWLFVLQYLHPFKAAEYRETSRAIRAIGRDCIKKRIQLIKRGEQAPNDILTHILQGACKQPLNFLNTCMYMYIYMVAAQGNFLFQLAY